ncbi:hypothetical protein PVAP13_7NG043100 [Panicum virgatum]|uniref:Uncharacterized protein n=1 Tax=Panicum virgatum TaxID=38727 RepID=A0A8T0PSQ0_PANVG|nr:hypothetical protein PVAP13_7NG043100 [Panicum virgatum]
MTDHYSKPPKKTPPTHNCLQQTEGKHESHSRLWVAHSEMDNTPNLSFSNSYRKQNTQTRAPYQPLAAGTPRATCSAAPAAAAPAPVTIIRATAAAAAYACRWRTRRSRPWSWKRPRHRRPRHAGHGGADPAGAGARATRRWWPGRRLAPLVDGARSRGRLERRSPSRLEHRPAGSRRPLKIVVKVDYSFLANNAGLVFYY